MCNPVLIYAGVTAVSGAYSAYNQYQQGVATNKYYNYLADQSTMQGQAALKAGAKQSELTQDTAKIQGKEQAYKSAETLASQRAAMAAMGMDPSSVSAQDVALSSMDKSRMDERAIRYNADIKSWESEYGASLENWQQQSQATQQRYAGKYAKWEGKTGAFSTLLGTAASIAGSGLLKGSTAAKPATSAAGYNSSWQSAGLSTKPWQSPSSGYARAFR